MTEAGFPVDVGELGNLVAVFGSYREVIPVDGGDDRFDNYSFQFDSGCLSVTASGEDDTIIVSNGTSEVAQKDDLTEVDPWAKFVGCGLLWMWTLRNQQGYVDGFQVEFSNPGALHSVQLICEASALTTYVLSRIRP